MTKAIFVAGLGFGDEGKGSVVDYLARYEAASLVVRYNGGAQAAHNVVQDDGRHHTFAQFGSGTFHGAKTFLSRFMLVNPRTLLNEAGHLQEVGVPDPLSLMYIDREAPITTPYHIAANMIRELARDNRHGSCGMGIGETMDAVLRYPDDVPRVKDLDDPNALFKKLAFVRDLKISEVGDLFPDNPAPLDDWAHLTNMLFRTTLGVVDQYAGFADKVNIVDRSALGKMTEGETVIFEGAQGVLLDQDWGFHPHTTWSKTTYENAYALVEDFNFPYMIKKIGISRTFSTRHGPGPFVCEKSQDEIWNSPEVKESIWRGGTEHNGWGEWQKSFRYGPLDTVMLRYAQEVLRCHEVALTHVNRKSHDTAFVSGYYGTPEYDDMFRMAVENVIRGSIRMPEERPTLEHQGRLTEALAESKPVTFTTYFPDDRYTLGGAHRRIIQSSTKVPVTIISTGPRTSDKRRV